MGEGIPDGGCTSASFSQRRCAAAIRECGTSGARRHRYHHGVALDPQLTDETWRRAPGMERAASNWRAST